MRSAFFAAARAACLALLLGAAAFPAAAAEPVLVEDFSPGSRPLEFLPGALAEVGGLLYFAGRDPQHGQEPWVSDGTAAGTRRLADLCPGPCSSNPGSFTGVGDHVLFFTADSFTLYALRAGKIEAIAREIGDARDFVTLRGVAFLRFGTSSEYMLRTDGTAEGTRVTHEFCAAETCYAPHYTKVGEAVYFEQGGKLFALYGEGDRRELGDGFDAVADFVATGTGKVVFRGCKGSECRAYATDGASAAGTVKLEPQPGGSFTNQAHHLVAWQGRVYFSNAAFQLLSTDGTPQGTRREAGFPGFEQTPFAANSTALLYTTRASADPLDRPFLYARSSQGADLPLTGPAPGWQLFGKNHRLGEKIFFTAEQELLATDGTPQGTVLLARFAYASDGLPFGGSYVFGLDPAGSEDFPGIFRSDGTADGTRRFELAQRRPYGTVALSRRLGSSLYSYLGFESGERQNNLYRIDPQSFAATPADSRRLGNIAEGRNVLYVGELGGPGARLIAVKERSVEDLQPGLVENAAVSADDHLFFTDDQPGQKLFESDGTAAGTRLLFDLEPGWVPQCPSHACPPKYPLRITPSGSMVFFVAEGSTGHPDGSLFAYRRGAAAPPLEIPFEGNFIGLLVAAPGGRVVFSMLDDSEGGAGMRLWLSDGTLAGTRPFFTLPDFHYPRAYAIAGQRLFFVAEGSPSRLYASDLQPGGTFELIADFGQRITWLQAAGDRLFFIGKPATGIAAELGHSDGTPAGTRWLDLVPGAEGARPSIPFPLDDGRVVFGAAADGAGHELWISDGSLPGTRRLTDLAPGAEASGPSNFAQVGNRLFFEASDGVVGFEPWALDLPPAAPLGACPADLLCLGGGRFEVAVSGQANGQPFQGSRVFAAADSGVFSFFSQDNWEMLVKVLDGCGINQSFWVYASAATDQPYQLTVRDRWSGLSKTYVSNGTSRPILDGEAFATCAAQPRPGYSPSPPGGQPAAICADDPGALCLGPVGRYRASLEWQTAGAAGAAMPVAQGSADSGLFTFFSPSNWELMVKLLDGCAINGKRWVFAAGTTDVGWKLTVTDRQTGAAETYQNPLGQPSGTVADIAAFGCADTP